MNLIYSERVLPRNTKESIYGIKEDEEENEKGERKGRKRRKEGQREGERDRQATEECGQTPSNFVNQQVTFGARLIYLFCHLTKIFTQSITDQIIYLYLNLS